MFTCVWVAQVTRYVDVCEFRGSSSSLMSCLAALNCVNAPGITICQRTYCLSLVSLLPHNNKPATGAHTHIHTELTFSKPSFIYFICDLLTASNSRHANIFPQRTGLLMWRLPAGSYSFKNPREKTSNKPCVSTRYWVLYFRSEPNVYPLQWAIGKSLQVSEPHS